MTAGVASSIPPTRARQTASTRQELVETLCREPRNEQAWFALSRIMPTLEQALRCVEHLLTINPAHEQAREQREVLQIRMLLEEAGVQETLSEPITTRRRRFLLGEALVAAGLLTPQQVATALHAQHRQALRQAPKPLGEILLLLGYITPSALDAALAGHVERSLTRGADDGRQRIGAYLVRRGLLTGAQLHYALQQQARRQQTGTSQRLGETVVALGYVSQAALQQALLAWHLTDA